MTRVYKGDKGDKGEKRVKKGERAPRPQTLRNVSSRYVTNHHATMMKQYDCVSHVVDRFLEPFMQSVRINDGENRYYT